MLLTLILGISQEVYSQSSLSGLGIEIGGGYNQLFLQFLASPFKDVRFDRTQFALTPEARLKYDIRIVDNFNLIPFVGYNRFGGKSDTTNNGYQDKVWFDVLEIGAFTSYSISNFWFGISDLEPESDASIINIRQNHLRLLLGYTL